MLFVKHALGLALFNLLFHSVQVFGKNPDITFETEFRLMVLTNDPDNMEMALEDGKIIAKHQDEENQAWKMEDDRKKEDGNARLGWLSWTKPSDQERRVWIYKKGEAKESGTTVSDSSPVRRKTFC
jgi:hypothetical protein